MDPVIIEVAINGVTSKAHNPHVPIAPEEIAAVAIACIEAGASIIHSHIEGMGVSGGEAAARYLEGWRPVQRRFPAAILYPTVVMNDDRETRFAHLAPLAAAGAAMAAFDPGSSNFGLGVDHDGLPGRAMTNSNGYDEIRFAFARCADLGIGASMGLYDPSYTRAMIAWHRAGKLPRGSFAKFYFGGEFDLMVGGPAAASFGLAPTAKALDACLEMIEGSGLPWAVAVLGGDVLASPVARLAVERGGHLRIGLEDYGGTRTPGNVELVDAAVALCRAVGRPVATCEQARTILGL